jgi:hypothetical protein
MRRSTPAVQGLPFRRGEQEVCERPLPGRPVTWPLWAAAPEDILVDSARQRLRLENAEMRLRPDPDGWASEIIAAPPS